MLISKFLIKHLLKNKVNEHMFDLLVPHAYKIFRKSMFPGKKEKRKLTND